MLFIAGYTIDRIVRIDEAEFKATLELASGNVCLIPTQEIAAHGLLEWAVSLHVCNRPMAMRIVDGIVVDAAYFFRSPVMALSPVGERPVWVAIGGRASNYHFANPQAEDEYYPALARSLATQRELLFLVQVTLIEAAIELSADELDNLKEMSSHPSLEDPLGHLMPIAGVAPWRG